MRHLGDFDAGGVLYGKFTTYTAATGAPGTMSGGTLAVYKDNSTSGSTTGVSLSVDFDSRTGFNHFTIDTSADGTFYAAGSMFDIVLTAGTVNGVSVAGGSVASFTLRRTAIGSRAGHLDADVSSRSTYAGGAVASVTAAVTVGTNNDKTGYALSGAGVQAIWDALTSAMTATGSVGKKLADWVVGTLTSGERTAIANEVEAQIIDDTDSEKVLTAITDKIASVNPDLSGLTLSAIASSVWSNGTRLLTAGTNIVLAKGTGLTGLNDLSAAQVNAEADTALADVGLTSTITGRIDVANSTRLASASYTAPDNASIAAIGGIVTSIASDATAILADTNELQTEWADGGRLDLILDGAAAGGSAPSASEVADEVQTRTLLADVRRVNGVTVNGSGTPSDPWGP